MKRFRKLLFLTLVVVVAIKGWLYWRAHRFDSAIAEAARRYQLAPALIRAVIRQESNFNPRARGRAGELGLMQIREAAALEWAASEHIRQFDHSACLNPLTNVLAGSWYLKQVMRHYKLADNPVPFGLAEYNAGRGNVLKWLSGPSATNSAAFVNNIGFASTKAYVVKIMERYDEYRSN